MNVNGIRFAATHGAAAVKTKVGKAAPRRPPPKTKPDAVIHAQWEEQPP